jgi:two-component sensor histidine kinase
MRSWTGANLRDIIVRALDAFSSAQVTLSGPALDVPPKQALALSLAFHELATNAVKYGPLSNPEGRLNVEWSVQDGKLRLDWEESGGPLVVMPIQKGFGSKLLEALVASDLGGGAKINYDTTGVRCQITATI